MNGSLTIRLAGQSDDAALGRLMDGISMPGQMELGASFGPSFFDSIEVGGERPRVIVGDREGNLEGVGLVTEKNVYLNGMPTRIGYLSSLRLATGIRNTTALSRGYRFLRHLLNQQSPPLPFCLSTIMQDNANAEKILCSGRASLPRYIRCGSYTTHVISVNRRFKAHSDSAFRISTGLELGPENLCRLLNEWGARRQFYPVYSPRDLIEPTGLLRGLGPEHFLVATDQNNHPAGLLACWDQMPFRHYKVKGYHGLLQFLYPLSRLAGYPLGRAFLPPPGKPVSCLHVACIAFRDEDSRAFDCLLGKALSRARELGRDYLVIGLAPDDPNARYVRRLAHLCLQSGVYLVGWGLSPDSASTLDGRPLYLELGSL